MYFTCNVHWTYFLWNRIKFKICIKFDRTNALEIYSFEWSHHQLCVGRGATEIVARYIVGWRRKEKPNRMTMFFLRNHKQKATGWMTSNMFIRTIDASELPHLISNIFIRHHSTAFARNLDSILHYFESYWVGFSLDLWAKSEFLFNQVWIYW